MGWLELLRSIVEMAYKPSEKAGDLLWEFFSWVHSEVSQAWGVDGELDKLRDTKEMICCLLRDVETWRSVTEERVLRWLVDLKDVALDAEDLLEEFTATGLALSGPPATGRKRKRSWRAPHILLRYRVAKEIVEIRNRYDAISEDRNKLGLRESEAPRRVLTEAPPTGAIIGLHTLGRDGDRERIVDLLLQQKPAGLHVVPIYGMAGQGKTALAKYIFNDEVRVAQVFKNRIWVCATRGFDVKRITKEILQSLTGRARHPSNFTMLQQQARELLAREPFLLVLDDVRGDGLLYWEDLQVCLQVGDGRSRVLITTRSEEVARTMGTLQQGRLNGLSDDDCFALFKQRVSPDEAFMERRPVLRDIGWKIVRKCQGSPLAAISLGGLLSGKTDETEWSSMLEEAAAFSQDGGGLDVLRVLRHAYELLPAHVKKCFAFCAIFPLGHQFDKDELVRMWMAQGFVEHRGNRRLEAMGGRFFDELLWMSFFQQAPDRDQNPECCPKYEVPRLLHEVLQSVSKHECFRMAGDDPRPHDVPERARHLALYRRNGGGPTTFPGFREHKRLRTLALQAETSTGIVVQLPSALFPKLTHLRMLDLGNTGISVLPDSIGELPLLRYLSLYNCPIERLPESVADLSNLQTLELGECYNLVELPEGTSNLTNLRHLGLHLDQQREVPKLISVPPGIGKLTSLQTLSRFAVGTSSGCGISEMKNLNPVGELWISRLENVSSLAEAREANLKDKSHIHTLTLQWTCSDVPDLQHEGGRVDVIECLQPPTQIKHLHVDGHDGATVPVWMGGGGGTSFSELVTLRLSNCKRWESLPSLGELPVLKELYIEGMHNIRSMDPMFSASVQRFPCLEKISLWDLPRLERWDVAEGDMPRLSELQIGQCPTLNWPVPYVNQLALRSIFARESEQIVRYCLTTSFSD